MAFKEAFLDFKRDENVNQGIVRQIRIWQKHHPNPELREFLRQVNMSQIDTTACYRQIRTFEQSDIMDMRFVFELKNQAICKQVGGMSVYDAALVLAAKHDNDYVRERTETLLRGMSAIDRSCLRFISSAKPQTVVNVKYGTSDYSYWKIFAVSGVAVCRSTPDIVSMILRGPPYLFSEGL